MPWSAGETLTGDSSIEGRERKRPPPQRGPIAENGGFEPPRALTQHAFQACAIGR